MLCVDTSDISAAPSMDDLTAPVSQTHKSADATYSESDPTSFLHGLFGCFRPVWSFIGKGTPHRNVKHTGNSFQSNFLILADTVRKVIKTVKSCALPSDDLPSSIEGLNVLSILNRSNYFIQTLVECISNITRFENKPRLRLKCNLKIKICIFRLLHCFRCNI